MSNQIRCSDVDELAGALALGALDAEEEAALREHLITCGQLHVEVHEALGAGVILAAALDPVDPPSALRDRLMATIERTSQAHRLAVAAPPPAARRGWFDWLPVRMARPLVLGAAVALLAVGAWNVSLQSQLSQRDAALRAVANAIAGSETAFRVDGSAGHGYVVDAPGAGAVLVIANVRTLPADRLYELWLIDPSGSPVAVGTFDQTDDALAVVRLERDLTGYATFAVTVETQRVTAPSGSLVMVSDLRVLQPS
ncbi:MAG: anti-sigma factor [Chloroflexi bacterium]|nr:anti-sigma factor [Chloroflexota bacterium]